MSNYVSVYQHKSDPAQAMVEVAEDAGFEVVSCEAPKLEFVFQNINYVKSSYMRTLAILFIIQMRRFRIL